ncbi:branched-chain amino acid ABC transporter permease [Bradyrhizobium sp. NP1]|uniref:branched-chain amino acid ABC transporter permease n=1 Tax=Bradyrhizobium sp. NP1 TaxID=3049772 RepID=UPI0025A68E71|nr:branched-chain amino acid ABC transporter permease [Bradyrhizobium sp. NP1]WJR76712.1 branched-chain amino acid ABC transporter permease [Bradyrhizobium sp. NP1]
MGSIYALTALGFATIYRASGVVNFAQGDMMMIGAMAALVSLRDFHLGQVAALLLAVGLCTLLGYLVERIAFRPLIDAPHFTVLLSTVAIGQILRSGVRVFYGQEVSILPPVLSTEQIDLLGVRVTPLQLGILGVAAATLIAVAAFFSLAKLGWGMRATSQNLRGAAIVGVNVPTVLSATWAMAGALAAIGGVLLAPMIIVTPDMGVIGNKGFIAAILGGFSSLGGAAAGGFILGVVEIIVGVYVTSAFKDVVVFVLLLGVLAALPNGIFGKATVSRV